MLFTHIGVVSSSGSSAPSCLIIGLSIFFFNSCFLYRVPLMGNKRGLGMPCRMVKYHCVRYRRVCHHTRPDPFFFISCVRYRRVCHHTRPDPFFFISSPPPSRSLAVEAMPLPNGGSLGLQPPLSSYPNQKVMGGLKAIAELFGIGLCCDCLENLCSGICCALAVPLIGGARGSFLS
ncbi:hypothetical protein Nhal_1549 [Nitrosococcus halophilus Nc 4]|uniref:Uncharacterized protein n=1 Tax=Nitrosococcus halophilus (strain Nc4) TaxID=472759 RepID=D5C1Q5_NITHN|nr:hypothetical protein Nhal_1549 [Nitrosococcus halophilus Nc 4]